MNHPTAPRSHLPASSRRDRLLLAVAVLLLLLLSWFGSIDRHSSDYVDSALGRSALAYASARGLNAVISVLQSTTFSVSMLGGVSVTGGELLDPVNDLVEQYASVMKLAIGSLLIQKVLLEIVSDLTFKWLITASGGVLLLALLLQRATLLWLALRVFACMVFLRFLLVFVVLLNSVVGTAFLDERIASDVAGLQTLTQEVDAATAGSTTPPETDSIFGGMRDQLSRLAGNLNPAQLRTQLEASTDNILNVMSLFVLETLLLPLLFLYLLSKGMAALFDIDLRRLLA